VGGRVSNPTTKQLLSTHILVVRVVGPSSTLGSDDDHLFGLGQHVLEDGVPFPPLSVVKHGSAVELVKVRRVVVGLQYHNEDSG
jgi:hypothetical protein